MLKLIFILFLISLFNFKYKNKQFSLLNESEQNNVIAMKIKLKIYLFCLLILNP